MTNDMHDTTYLRKKAAARFMDLSPRRVLELASQGVLRSRVVTDARTRQKTKEVLKADCQRYLDSFKKQSVEVVTVQPRSADAAHPPHAPVVELPPAPLAIFVDLNTAAEISGLPASHLLASIFTGELPARDVGVRPGGRYRVRRSDLEGLQGRAMVRAIAAA